jgi:hypothetical protein
MILRDAFPVLRFSLHSDDEQRQREPISHSFDMDVFLKLVGAEHSINKVSRTICNFVQGLNVPVVGAMHITCADESERECIQAFQKGFVNHLLPNLKFANQSTFRLANLGARYDWGAVRVAEHHYAVPESEQSYKIMVVKVNSHVGVMGKGADEQFGTLCRYGVDSTCCGALNALLAGKEGPFLHELHTSFSLEGKDRVKALNTLVAPEHRYLFAALASARLQARQVMIDIQDYKPATPTFYFVIPCVTLNRLELDTEIVCGFYTADHREQKPAEHYYGLGDDPTAYRFSRKHDRIIIEDDAGTTRNARNHRQAVLDEWHKHKPIISSEAQSHIKQVLSDVGMKRHQVEYAKPILKMLLPVLAGVAPIPAALLMFASGASGIYNVCHAHKLARQNDGEDEARIMLKDISAKIENMEPAKAKLFIEQLVSHCKVDV